MVPPGCGPEPVNNHDARFTEKKSARVSGFQGRQRNTVGVLAMVILAGMGERMAGTLSVRLIHGFGTGQLQAGMFGRYYLIRM